MTHLKTLTAALVTTLVLSATPALASTTSFNTQAQAPAASETVVQYAANFKTAKKFGGFKSSRSKFYKAKKFKSHGFKDHVVHKDNGFYGDGFHSKKFIAKKSTGFGHKKFSGKSHFHKKSFRK